MPYEKDKITHRREVLYYSWRLDNPISKYIYCYKYDNTGNINAYIILKEIGRGKYDLIDYNYLTEEDIKSTLSIFVKKIAPFYVLYWTVNPDSLLSKSPYSFRFYSLSFILNKFQKFRMPPFLVRPFDCIDPELKSIISNIHQWNLFKIIGDEI